MATKKTSRIDAALLKTDPVVRAFVDSLKKENGKLQREVATLEAKVLSAENRIVALKKRGVDPVEALSPEQVSARLAELERELGIEQMKKRIAELEQKLDDSKP